MSPTLTHEQMETTARRLEAEARRLLSTAENEQRQLDPTEADRIDELTLAVAEIREQIDRRTEQHQREADLADAEKRYGPLTSEQRTTADPRHRHRPLTRDQSLTDWSRSNSVHTDRPLGQLDFGRLVRGLVTGNWDDATAEHRAMSEGTASAGGYTVPVELAVDVIDRARNMMQVVQAGARTVPMTTQTLKMARVDADPAASWHTENAAITPSDGTFGQITFTAQTLTVITVASLELFEDSVNIGEVLSNSIAQSIAQEWDRVALRGSGTAPEPRGVRNQAGVTITALNGQANGATPTSYDLLIDSNQVLRAGNFEPTAYIMAPRTDTTLSKLKDSTGQPLRTPDAVAAIPRLRTNQIPTTLTKGTSTDCSDVYTGDWQHLLLGMRTGLQIRLLDQRYIDNGQFGLFAYMRGDVQLARAGAFNVTEGIRP